MILYNVTCNVTQEVENQWLEWVDLQLNNISKSEKEIVFKNLSKYKFIKKLYQGQKISFKLVRSCSIANS